ncbi:uncharacterized protein DNG_06252 [Cephalotrichum gorgonifer]|uniref:Heterokaryon incompatibility domain-containing protein n=1 Tax=Cephalotrichum gorgonifer TaxID=2041049 RepID=A0AAE8SWF3_9PEZI|nr:uncharacterized protein DNG_06252 [Cephalotrichum gorgonifer]
MFKYTPLDRRSNEFRLVRFTHPDNPEAPIALELRHAHIGPSNGEREGDREGEKDSHTRFSAISYLWGDVKNTIDIQVNGQPFSLGSNLHAALVVLRKSVDSWFWVDSICINQSDLEEKSWHVNDMRAIYGGADLVYMWLGPGSNDTDRAMDFVSRLGPRAIACGVLDSWVNRKRWKVARNSIRIRPPAQHGGLDANTAVSELEQFIYSLLQEAGLHEGAAREEDLQTGILNLLQRDYWHRIWIIQEVALANEAIVMCGERSVPLSIFDETFTAIWTCKRMGLPRTRPEYGEFCSRLSGTLYTIKALTTYRKRRLNDPILLADILVEFVSAPDRPFYSASDPRDIVFGLLGVIDDAEKLGLHADYSRSLIEVFTAVTRALICHGDENSHPFHLDRCIPRQRNPDNLPTWVPDWREIGRYGFKIWPVNNRRAFDATAGVPSPSPLDTSRSGYGNPAVLRRVGCHVDVITEVMKPPRWVQFDEWSVARIADADDYLSSVFKFAGLGPDSGPGEDYVWRTIRRDSIDATNRPNSKKPVSERTAQLIRKIMRQERVDVDTLKEDQRKFIRSGPYKLHEVRPDLETVRDQLDYVESHWPYSIGSSNRGRTLFKTAKGMFGLGHVAIRAGDVVTLFWGVKSPIILRPRDGESDGFHLMGDAYVDGIMKAEFLETKPVEREFDIY